MIKQDKTKNHNSLLPSVKKKWFFGWTNIKWGIKEIIFIYSSERSTTNGSFLLNY